MKKLLFIAGILFFLSPVTSSAGTDSTNFNMEIKLVERPRIKEKEILERLGEIQAMDFKNMSKEERKAIKRELKEIKETSGLDNRISISVGALIIIILLIILIF